TGRGIGPAYEDKVARRAVRVADLFHRERFAAKLGEALNYHNFLLQHYYKADPVDFQSTLDEYLALATQIEPMVADVTALIKDMDDRGENILFEGAQGALLDVDHGTYPFVTSSNTTAGGAATGTGIGPRAFDHVLGIVKAYCTRVGGGPFPTELFDAMGEHLARRGHEFGSVTGRPRRTGWFDVPSLKRSIVNNTVSGLCVTKLDVLDGLDTISICTGYRDEHGAELAMAPMGAETMAAVTPVYEEMPGWQESTLGITKYDGLPAAARAYLERLQELCGVPVDMISTGAEREHTIVLHNPFD
ncbi:MAG: adenylosuccinate synthase, partial [Xanthomonadaceae bacterium]|nr:adenylosuccinate synthase [Xanthomonadaceae bacterium]